MENKGKYGSLVGKRVKIIFIDTASISQIHTTTKIGVLDSYDNSFLTLRYPELKDKLEGLPISRIIRIEEIR